MFSILKVITDRLEVTGYPIYFNEKDKKADFPFVIFNVPLAEEGTNRYQEDILIEIDIWTKDLEKNITMTNNIRNLMHKYRYLSQGIQVSFYVINRLNNIPDSDDQIKRSQLRILAKTYYLN